MRWGKNLRLIFVLATLAFLSGCGYVKSSLTRGSDGGDQILPPFFKTSDTEFVASAVKNKATPNNGFKVNTSMGSMTNKIEMTTPNGYKVFTSVEGRISAE